MSRFVTVKALKLSFSQNMLDQDFHPKKLCKLSLTFFHHHLSSLCKELQTCTNLDLGFQGSQTTNSPSTWGKEVRLTLTRWMWHRWICSRSPSWRSRWNHWNSGWHHQCDPGCRSSWILAWGRNSSLEGSAQGQISSTGTLWKSRFYLKRRDKL